ncbi:hypothetical protein ACFE04_018480 [Oxalis oulophora]
MERHIESLLNKISLTLTIISTILLLYVYLQTPQTCIHPTTPLSKPNLKFPSSTCDSSLLHHHHYIPPSKKTHKLWSSNSWKKQVFSYTHFFNNLKFNDDVITIRNETRILCVSAGAGHVVMALKQMGVEDVTGVDVVDTFPLVSKADMFNLPFFDHVFDFAFTEHLDEALFPRRYVGEMERTVRKGGELVVLVEDCDGEEDVKEIVGLFEKSEFVSAFKVNLVGARMTRIIMRRNK